MLKAILCCDSKNGIGLKNKIPWKIKEEMDHFVKETSNATVVMGRKTFNSLGNKPLKNRKNIVFTRNFKFDKKNGVQFTNDLNLIIKLSKKKDVYIIGGAEIYKLFENYIEEYIVSLIDKDYECDTFFTFSKKLFKLKFVQNFEKFKVEKWVKDKKILDGRRISGEIIESLKNKFVEEKIDFKKNKIVIIQVGEDFASSVYISRKIKVANYIGFVVNHVLLDKNVSQQKLILEIRKYNKDKNIKAILVQNPLPSHIDENKIAIEIDKNKDVDCFNPVNLGILFRNKKEKVLSPCTPLGIITLLKAYKINMISKKVVIINRSNIVGKPLAILFLNEDSTVTVCHTKTKNIKNICKKADILISATGVPKWIKSDYIKKGAICIDVGINRDQNGICGDFDFENVLKKCSFISPVPFGIGPMTIAILFLNLMKIIHNNSKKINM